jgi:hypothetical protein
VTIGSPVAPSLIPDGFFGLHFFKEEQESYFMYEKDRGEMPIERSRRWFNPAIVAGMAIGDLK